MKHAHGVRNVWLGGTEKVKANSNFWNQSLIVALIVQESHNALPRSHLLIASISRSS